MSEESIVSLKREIEDLENSINTKKRKLMENVQEKKRQENLVLVSLKRKKFAEFATKNPDEVKEIENVSEELTDIETKLDELNKRKFYLKNRQSVLVAHFDKEKCPYLFEAVDSDCMNKIRCVYRKDFYDRSYIKNNEDRILIDGTDIVRLPCKCHWCTS
jgi:hypothetical protein